MEVDWKRSRREYRRRPWLVLALALLLLGCEKQPPALARSIHSSIALGLACVAQSYDGNSFNDDYLRFVYPGESLESPLPGYQVTYRVLDAYFIVLMIRRSGIQPGEAQNLFDRAEALTAALARDWRSRGIYNLRRNPEPLGLALDSYAILAILQKDPEMARVVEAGLDGDGWLAPDFYTGGESFRRLADESWAIRALLLVNPQDGARLVRNLGMKTRLALKSERDPAARANLVIHALLAVADLPGQRSAAEKPESTLGEPWESLRKEALDLLRDPAILRDSLTLANLVGVLVPDTSLPDAALSPHIRELLRRQDKEGCWRVSLDSGDASGRVFATLRVVLTLGEYNRWRLKGKGGP
jgi:hypothetical protein